MSTLDVFTSTFNPPNDFMVSTMILIPFHRWGNSGGT